MSSSAPNAPTLPGQVAGVLEHGVFQAFIVSVAVLSLPLVPVPQSLPDLVERVGHPETMWNESSTLGVRQVLLHAGVDPFGAVAGDRLDGGALLVGQLSEEQVETLPYPSCAQTTRLRLWSTTTVMRAPFL